MFDPGLFSYSEFLPFWIVGLSFRVFLPFGLLGLCVLRFGSSELFGTLLMRNKYLTLILFLLRT